MKFFAEATIKVSRFLTGAAFFVLMGSVLVQVLGRSVFNNAPVWTEELTRFGLLFLAAFGAGLSYRSGDLVNVDLVSESLPGRWPWRLRFIGAVTTALLCICLVVPAWKFTSIGAMQGSPALGWRMDFIHVSMLVLIVSLMLFSGARALLMLASRSDGLPIHQGDELVE